MSLNLISQCRLEVGDNDVSFPILSNEEYEYFLNKHSGSVRRASLDAAKTILFKLSMRVRERVELFEIHGAQAATNYIQALKLYIKDPNLNPIYTGVALYAGGISISDMQSNDNTADNNVVMTPDGSREITSDKYFSI